MKHLAEGAAPDVEELVRSDRLSHWKVGKPAGVASRRVAQAAPDVEVVYDWELPSIEQVLAMEERIGGADAFAEVPSGD